ncbi:MAG: hypothetical protein A2383_03280 [Candidatus Pacebacteria bacterium RIFOXYB1_FULL_39_46]|nr:MAG: hypothetical protein A2182_01325 [Candidatus Pacebacteria bacterium RIFOXYA1_FULL_38_18]OGJ38440.1 MAG: hypothetical protein A2383_03280 [Candidatus Pacebacteria bacterium RIFOXYB1_FULL_39_46]OGJ40300.1 MAG: hypothetical protein A2411_03420 [Candidatus Pacebacteria bacterium RIFOXYC1_FULL_39_21]OGJ40873.1 MAG: hypothetical protein A2582_02160 [Candidatus Pacebacteria bacterium RIFOXYD1_FULL_39_27]
MQRFILPKIKSSIFEKEHGVFWFSSKELLLIWDKKKKSLFLPVGSGFADGQVADVDVAAHTVIKLCEMIGLSAASFFIWQSATVFVPTLSSPLERKIIKQVFQKAGFQKINLVTFATALKTFAQRQAIREGVGLYLGDDVSEAVIFSQQEQLSLNFDYLKKSAYQTIRELLQSEVALTVSQDSVAKLYQALGQNLEIQSFVLRGKNIQNQQVVTLSLSRKQLKTIIDLLQKNLELAWRRLTANNLFTNHNLDQWLVVGDAFVYHFMQKQQVAQVLFLHSELEIIQGVEWF